MKKISLFLSFVAAVIMTGCTATKELNYAGNARETLADVFEGNYYICETATYNGITTISETMEGENVRFCRMTNDVSDVRIIDNGNCVYIIDEINDKCTVQSVVNDDVFRSQAKFLESVFAVAVTDENFVEKVVSETDKTVYELYRVDGTYWKFTFDGTTLTKIENLASDMSEIARYEYIIEPDTFYDEKIKITEKYEITDMTK